MSVAIITAVIGLIGSLVVAALTFWSTKRREREAEWRKEKLGYYKAFVESISGILEGDASPEGQRLFAKATNNLLLFANSEMKSVLQIPTGQLKNTTDCWQSFCLRYVVT
jgi:hypothetical protein